MQDYPGRKIFVRAGKKNMSLKARHVKVASKEDHSLCDRLRVVSPAVTDAITAVQNLQETIHVQVFPHWKMTSAAFMYL